MMHRTSLPRVAFIAVVIASLLGVALVGCESRRVAYQSSRMPTQPGIGATRAFAGNNPTTGATSSDRAVEDLRSAMPGSLPSQDEEVWVIARSHAAAAAAPDDEQPGSGAMIACPPGQTTNVPVPLEHTDVHARIDGYVASVHVDQRFHNPYDGKIEAVYVFPLPDNAAVDDFVMQIGSRRIRGIIRDRRDAERIYHEARAQGYVASLLTQERPNIFTQKVANIEPGKSIDVDIRYFHTLRYDDGWYEWHFPMTIGPRFNPPSEREGVGAVTRGHTGISGQPTEVSYLRPTERSGHDVSLSVDIHAGMPIGQVECKSHQIRVARPTTDDEPVGADDDVHVTLADRATIANRDFVLRWRVAGDRLAGAMLTQRDDAGSGYFSLMLYPPHNLDRLPRQPLEMIYVIDCSGSMSGRPIEQAKAAVRRSLDALGPDDTFQIIQFSNTAARMAPQPIHATEANVRAGRRYVDHLGGAGGTMMIEGIKAALDFHHDPSRLRYVVFLTDGYIGNESQILTAMRARLGDSHVFSFGVGQSPNRFLMDAMARLGRGAVAYLSLDDDAADVMDRFMSRVSHPAMTHVSVDFGAMHVTDVEPADAGDLFVGRPFVIAGRFSCDQSRVTLHVHGIASGHPIDLPVHAVLHTTPMPHPALAAVWARRRIASLYDRALILHSDGDAADDAHIESDRDVIAFDLPRRVREIALKHNLVSAYTAFVAVDASRRTSGDDGTTVPVPVPVPDGTRYSTTVAE